MRIRSPVLIGRQHELGLLREWLAEARAGRPRLVIISGEAGIGKSRLLEEVSALAKESSDRWLVGAAADGLDRRPCPTCPAQSWEGGR